MLIVSCLLYYANGVMSIIHCIKLLPKSGAPIPAAVPRETEELEEEGGWAALRSNSAILFLAWVKDVLVALLSGSISSACSVEDEGGC